MDDIHKLESGMGKAELALGNLDRVSPLMISTRNDWTDLTDLNTACRRLQDI